MTFMITVQDYDKQAQINIVRVTYFTSGRQYNFFSIPFPCKPDLQNVELMLICQGKTGNLWIYIWECIHKSMFITYIYNLRYMLKSNLHACLPLV